MDKHLEYDGRKLRLVDDEFYGKGSRKVAGYYVDVDEFFMSNPVWRKRVKRANWLFKHGGWATEKAHIDRLIELVGDGECEIVLEVDDGEGIYSMLSDWKADGGGKAYPLSNAFYPGQLILKDKHWKSRADLQQSLL